MRFLESLSAEHESLTEHKTLMSSSSFQSFTISLYHNIFHNSTVYCSVSIFMPPSLAKEAISWDKYTAFLNFWAWERINWIFSFLLHLLACFWDHPWLEKNLEGYFRAKCAIITECPPVFNSFLSKRVSYSCKRFLSKCLHESPMLFMRVHSQP